MHTDKAVYKLHAFLVATMCIMFFSLQSCETVGYENVDTTRKTILVANAELRGANLLLQDLIRKDLISDSDAQKALDDIRTAHGYLQSALDTININGDSLQANTRLDRATVYLSNIINLLAQFTEEP